MKAPGHLAAAVALLVASGCVEPQYGDAPFACARTSRCPAGYRCVDGLCERSAAPGTDGGPDGTARDGGQDRGDQRPPEAGSSDGARADLGDDPRLAPFRAAQPLTALNDPASGDDNPSLTGDLLEIFFDSSRSTGRRRRSDTDLWTAKRSGPTAAWENPTNLGALNSGQDERTPEVSNDGLTLFFASARQGGTYTDIYVTTRSSRTTAWGAAGLVGTLSSAKDDRSPTPASDLRTMVLASNRTGGAGAMDLYASARTTATAEWDAPALIAELSTAAAEDGPWTDSSGTLIYFASDRPGGAGGFDLWRAVRPTPGVPYGAAAPVAELNSAGYDGGCWLSADGSVIVFASSRDGNLDLYSATR